MHKVILFRGGMCGDVIFSMLHKKYISSIYPLKQVKERRLMKKFYNYTENEKKEYFNLFNNSNTIEYTLSHDTNFCQTIKENVIQLYCSDLSMLYRFSERFWIKNEFDAVEHVIKDMNTTPENKIKDYANDILNWQTAYVFPNRFDIKNIFDSSFSKQLIEHFSLQDINYAKFIHSQWLKTEN